MADKTSWTQPLARMAYGDCIAGGRQLKGGSRGQRPVGAPPTGGDRGAGRGGGGRWQGGGARWAAGGGASAQTGAAAERPRPLDGDGTDRAGRDHEVSQAEGVGGSRSSRRS